MNRTTLLGTAMLAIGTGCALVLLAQVWLNLFDWDLVGKLIATFALGGGLLIFTVMILLDYEASKNKLLLALLACDAVFAALLVLDRLWVGFVSWDMFLKLIISAGIVGVLISFVLAVKEDFIGSKRLKDNNFID